MHFQRGLKSVVTAAHVLMHVYESMMSGTEAHAGEKEALSPSSLDDGDLFTCK